MADRPRYDGNCNSILEGAKQKSYTGIPSPYGRHAGHVQEMHAKLSTPPNLHLASNWIISSRSQLFPVDDNARSRKRDSNPPPGEYLLNNNMAPLWALPGGKGSTVSLRSRRMAGIPLRAGKVHACFFSIIPSCE